MFPLFKTISINNVLHFRQHENLWLQATPGCEIRGTHYVLPRKEHEGQHRHQLERDWPVQWLLTWSYSPTNLTFETSWGTWPLPPACCIAQRAAARSWLQAHISPSHCWGRFRMENIEEQAARPRCEAESSKNSTAESKIDKRCWSSIGQIWSNWARITKKLCVTLIGNAYYCSHIHIPRCCLKRAQPVCHSRSCILQESAAKPLASSTRASPNISSFLPPQSDDISI